jgi:hypothetical protein
MGQECYFHTSIRVPCRTCATLTRNRVVPAGLGEEAAFEIPSEPTPLQARALALIGVSPASVQSERRSLTSRFRARMCPPGAGSSV